MTDTTDTIELIDRAEIKDGQAIVAYTRTEAALAALREKYKDARYDLTTTAGDKAARAARLELTTTRTSLEKKRKELKAPAVEFGRKVDAEAARLTAELLALEAPIDAQIKADEKRREDERRAREEAEAARRKVHTDGIARIAGYVGQAADLNSARIGAGIAFLEGLDLSGFEEYVGEAEATRSRSVEALRALQVKAKAREDEAARLEAERIEQARVAAEQAETARKLKEQQDALARQQAEVEERARAVARQEQEAREAEERRQKAAAEEAERQRIAAAEAEQRRQEAAAELAAAKANPEGAELSPAAQALNEQEGATRFAEHHPQQRMDRPYTPEFAEPTASPAVIPMPTRAPAAPTGQPTLRLGEIQKRLAPVAIDAAGLASLGFPFAKQEGAAKLWHEADFPRICTALINHIAAAQRQQQAA